MTYNLMWLLVLPFIASVLALASFPLPQRMQKGFAFMLSLIPLALLCYYHTQWMNSSVNYEWLPTLSIQFFLKIDPLSLLFLFLTAIIIPISILSVSSQQLSHPNLFYALVLFLQGLLIGFFTARDLVLFTIFWESILLPLYLIINLWGGPQRQNASLKFIVYMIAGSTLMVVAVLALYFASSLHGINTFNMELLSQTVSSMPYALTVGAIFLLAFAVKTPLFPFHAWLPDTYCQAPTAGTILLAALLSKAGIYGFLRIGLGLFSAQIIAWSPWLLGLAIAGVFYGGLAAWRQNDFKRLIAYSSFSHVNFILVGIFIWNETAHAGAILQAFNHGITITALFLVSGWLESRLGTTSMLQQGGLAHYYPHLCWLTLFFVLSSVALPGMNNFIGELLIFFGLAGQHFWLTAFLGLTVILSVIYMLRWMQRVYFGPVISLQAAKPDIHAKEFAIAIPLIALILWVGLYPMPFLQYATLGSEKNNSIAILEVAP